MQERGVSHLSDYEGKRDIDTAVIIAYERSDALKTDLERDDGTFHCIGGRIILNLPPNQCHSTGSPESERDFGEDEKLVQFARILAMAKLFRSDDFSPTHIFWLVRVKRLVMSDVISEGGPKFLEL